ncbi:MAG: Cna B-type domain-containing protein [Oscillospiraceae bacterium]|nr:Cna B-type domain-containing protein [Oscillospiraceae bacterium]
MKKLNRRISKSTIAMMLVAVMAIAILPGSVEAETPPPSGVQIAGQGAWTYYDGDGKSTADENNFVVATNKTIEGTEEENVFDITLQVKTTVETQNIEVSPDAAVVLVIDISNSMAGSKLAQAKQAAKDFLDSYIYDAGDAARKLSIVTFGPNSNVYNSASPWFELDSSNIGTVKAYIDGLSAGGGTFTQGALMHARNLYLPANAPEDAGGAVIGNRFVVMLTDGNPTYYSTDSTSQSLLTLTQNSGNGAESNSNVSPSSRDAKPIADQIKSGSFGNYDAILYTIGFGISGSAFSRNGTTSGTAVTGDEWLADAIADKHFTVQNASGLNDAFKKIAETISMIANAWVVDDPMADYINYGYIIPNANPGVVNTASFAGGALKWNIKHSDCIDSYDRAASSTKTETVYIYELKYRISFDNLTSDAGGIFYEAQDIIPTNGKTTLTYIVDNLVLDDSYFENPGNVIKTAEFIVPEIFGYEANDPGLSFVKMGSDGKPLGGVEFKLAHKDGCGCETLAPGWYATAVSDFGGSVIFDNIPSGHKYSLTEISAPASILNEYHLNPAAYDVTVGWGIITANTLPDGKDGGKIFENKQKTIDLTVLKIWADKENYYATRPSSVKFNLLCNGAKIGEYVMTAPSWVGHTFEDLPTYDGNLELTYEITEEGVEGYESSYEIIDGAYVFTNKLSKGETGVTVSKDWDDGGAADKRPASIKFNLLQNGTKISEYVMAAPWATFTFDKLDKYDDTQTLYEYAVEEETADGYYEAFPYYDENQGAFEFSNRRIPSEAEITITKILDIPEAYYASATNLPKTETVCGLEHKHTEECVSSGHAEEGVDYNVSAATFTFKVEGAGEADGEYTITFGGDGNTTIADGAAGSITVPIPLDAYVEIGAIVEISEVGLPDGWNIASDSKQTIEINKFGDISGEGGDYGGYLYGPGEAVFVNSYDPAPIPYVKIVKQTINARTGNRENAPENKMIDFNFTISGNGIAPLQAKIPATWFIGGEAGIKVYLPELRGKSAEGLSITENQANFGAVWSILGSDTRIVNGGSVTFENRFKDDKYPAINVRKSTNVPTEEVFAIEIGDGSWSGTFGISPDRPAAIDFKDYGETFANYTGTLTLKETGSKENWTYDATIYSITVKDGEITSGSSSFTFANTYEEPIVITETPKITISKTMTINTNRAEPETPTFEFELYDETNARAVGTFNITGSGSLTIDLGAYGYANSSASLKLKEVIPENLSYYWSYDARVYTVTLQSGEITGFACSDGSSVTGSTARFTNVYSYYYYPDNTTTTTQAPTTTTEYIPVTTPEPTATTPPPTEPPATEAETQAPTTAEPTVEPATQPAAEPETTTEEIFIFEEPEVPLTVVKITDAPTTAAREEEITDRPPPLARFAPAPEEEVIVEQQPLANFEFPEEETEKENPKTGADMTAVILITAMFGIGASGMLYYRSKKRAKK